MKLLCRKNLILCTVSIVLLLGVAFSAKAQQTSVAQALKTVTKVFGTHFIYEKSLLEGKSTSYNPSNFNGKTAEEALKQILYPQGLVFLYVKENYYTILTKERLGRTQAVNGPGDHSDEQSSKHQQQNNLAFEQFAAKQNNRQFLKGRVLDSTGNPLEGVSVRVRKTKEGATTDGNGRFSLEANLPATLEWSSIGFETVQMLVENNEDLRIILHSNSTDLGKVVVVGYGTQKKIDLTGSIATIDAKEISEDHSNVNVTDMLAGRIPGLFAVKTGGAPGTGSNLYIRGLGTTNNSSPLVVVDGIPDRDLNILNPLDIQSVSVLKDAASIAVYGARAANGVILITTKKGGDGIPVISFNMNMINQRPTQVYKTLNSYQYASLYNEALKNEDAFNPALGQGYTEEELQKFQDGSDPDHYPNTDWVKEVLSPSMWQSAYNLSASGGTQNTQYYLSAGYVKDNGLFPVEGFKRYNLRSNIVSTIARNLKLQMDLSGIFTNSHDEGVYGSEYIISQVYNTPPIRVNQFSNGYYAYVPEQRGNGYLQSRQGSGFWKSENNVVNANLSLEYQLPFVKGLSLKGTMAFDKIMGFQKKFATPYDMYNIDAAGEFTKANASPTTPSLREYYGQTSELTYEGSMHYDNRFGDHHVTGLVLYTQTQINGDNFNTQRSNFVSGSLPELSLGDPTQVTNAGGGSQSARQGVVGRLTYDYKNKYMAEFNFRRDGSDIFPPNRRFGFFPSVSAGWVLSQENFFEKIRPMINFLKLRGSWGQLGNDRVNPYQFLSTYTLVGGTSSGGGYSFGGTNPVYYQSLRENVLPNPNFTWERANMTNIGLEAQLWHNLLSIDMDYYRKRTKDILIPPSQQAPSVIGIGLPDQNNGMVDNSGFELTLTHRRRIGEVEYYISPNVSFTKNKVIAYPESSSIPEWQRMTGKSVPFMYGDIVSATDLQYYMIGYHALGLYQTQEEIDNGPTPLYPDTKPGDIRYADINGDGQITAADQTLMNAHFFPAVQYGIKYGISYKGIELNVLMQGAANVDAYTYLNLNNYNEILLDRWTPENTNAGYPRLWYNNQNNEQTSDYWVKKTSYLRLKNLEFAYNLPEDALKKIGVKSCRLSLGGNNLLTFTHFKQFDPESAGVLRDPLMKSFTLGASFKF